MSQPLLTTAQRAQRLAYWLLPPLFCLALYWYALSSWFEADDFVWLRLPASVQSWRDLWRAIFAPTPHGTFRPLSERLYFLVFGSLFPLDALPFRIWAFLTQFANLALVASITRRITGSRMAGFWAPVFWTANSSLATAMVWSSAYMQILCGFFLLLAFHFLLRHIETGRRRYYWLQWAVFLAGFLAMETNVVYPALAASYTWLYARKQFRKTLPLAAVSLGFVVFHSIIAPKQAAGPYSLHFDAALPGTLLRYWRWSLEPFNLQSLTGYPGWVGTAGAVLFTLVLLGFTVWAARRRDWRPLLFLAWFAILLVPVLPLREHRSRYYLTLPAMGLGMLLAYALVTAWRYRLAWKVIAGVLALAFFSISVPGAWAMARWDYEHTQDVRALVFGVAGARKVHPRQVILLSGVTDRLFWSAVRDGAFQTAGVSGVYLDPLTQALIQPSFGRVDVSQFILPVELLPRALDREEVVVYEVGGPRLKNITRSYAGRLQVPPDATARRVDVSNPLAAYLLGPSWHPLSDNHRWMPERATVRLGGPRSAGEKLHVSGFCPAVLLQQGPLEMRVSAEGTPLSTVRLSRGDAHFRLDFDLPRELVGRPVVEVEIRVNRTVRHPAWKGGLGLVFGVFEIR